MLASDKHNVLLAASEVVGFAKTGGLADVAGSLPRALARRGHSCAIVLPLYRSARQGPVPLSPTHHTFTVPIGSRDVTGSLQRAILPDSDVPVYLVEQPEYYERDDVPVGRGLYQLTLPNGQKRDYPDNCERFVFFCRAVLEVLPLLDEWPGILHLNDWQTGLVPVYLREVYQHHPDASLRSRYERLRTLLTIHNIAYQGVFPQDDMAVTGLDARLFNPGQLEFYGRLNFLKGGVVFADAISTVSSMYAREIQTPYYGCGLDGVLTGRRQPLHGIVNGADYDIWNPAIDPYLAAPYAVETVARGKSVCKAALQRAFGLPEQPGTPLLSMVTRLVQQKGIHLVIKSADVLLQQEQTHLVILGEGDPVYHRALEELRARYPQRLGLRLGFDEPLAHHIEAGADIFLMPSLYEPSGLNQLYSLKYGTVPVVHATGGLADTITDYTPAALAAGSATGFTFLAQTPAAFLATVQRALEVYRHHPEDWLRLQQNGMRQDWSWNHSAVEYERVYSSITASRAA